MESREKMKHLIFLFPLYILADAKGEIENINKLLEKNIYIRWNILTKIHQDCYL